MATRKVYVVQQLNWQYNDEYFYRGYGEGDDEAIKAFKDREKAEAHRQEQEDATRDAWRELNPFEFGGIGEGFSSLSNEELGRQVEAIGLTPPAEDHDFRDWCYWWEQVRTQLTEEQEARIWELTDRVRFYEVVEVEMED